MSGVSNAAEDDQATVRPTSFGLRSPRTADKRERGDAGKALARWGWRCWCAARSKRAFDLAARRLKPRDRHGRRPALDVHGGGSSCLLPAGCRAARSRCGKAARPTGN